MKLLAVQGDIKNHYGIFLSIYYTLNLYVTYFFWFIFILIILWIIKKTKSILENWSSYFNTYL